MLYYETSVLYAEGASLMSTKNRIASAEMRGMTQDDTDISG